MDEVTQAEWEEERHRQAQLEADHGPPDDCWCCASTRARHCELCHNESQDDDEDCYG